MSPYKPCILKFNLVSKCLKFTNSLERGCSLKSNFLKSSTVVVIKSHSETSWLIFFRLGSGFLVALGSFIGAPEYYRKGF